MKTFNEINKIDVSKYVEKKGKFNYLSWAYAWMKIKELDNEATFRVIENSEGLPFHYDKSFPKLGAFVKVEITFNKISLTQTHPVLNHMNKSIAVESLDSFTINTSIQRALAKAAALHGLGLYIYAGEDLPEKTGSIETPIKSETKIKINLVLKDLKEVYGITSEKDVNSLGEAEAMLFLAKITKVLEKKRAETKALSEKIDKDIENLPRKGEVKNA